MLYTFDSLSLTTLAELSNEDLMKAIVRRDEAAFEELYRRNKALIFTVIKRVLNDETAAEDVMQELFTELWLSPDRYCSTKGKFLGWLKVIAQRRAIDRIRRLSCRTRAEDKIEQEFADSPMGARQEDVGNEVESLEMKEVLSVAIARLPLAQQEALKLSYFQSLSQRQIAASTGIPLGTIKTRLDLAMRKLSAAVREMVNDSVAQKQDLSLA